jgi:hypothetical protein
MGTAGGRLMQAVGGMDVKQSSPARPASGRGAERADGPESAFDLWLNHRLHQLYDSVAQEPLPPELLRLIETDRTRRGE